MRPTPTLVLVSLVSLVVAGLAACGRTPSEGDTAAAPAPAAAIAWPAGLFPAAPPEGAVALIEAKGAAGPGDRIVFTARIGGRKDAFVEDRAMFFVADPSLPDCEALHADACKTPWDYCCEPADNLLKHMATVQVVDADGRPLHASLRDEHGLAHSRTVVVVGTVATIDDAGNLVVNAETIHVAEQG